MSHQRPDMEVALAAAQAGAEVARADEFFWADDRGAFLRRGGSDEALTPSTQSRLVDINSDGPIDRPFLGPQLLTDPAFRSAFGPRVMSTPLAVAWVAGGRRAGYVSDGLFVENVHYTAGIALCHSAGCVVTASLGSRWKTVAASSSPRAMTDAAETKRRAGVSSA